MWQQLSLSLSFIPDEAGLGTAAVCDCTVTQTLITDFSSESATTPRTVEVLPLKLLAVLMFHFLSAVFTLAAAQKCCNTSCLCV